jgi:hypothetical protein
LVGTARLTVAVAAHAVRLVQRCRRHAHLPRALSLACGQEAVPSAFRASRALPTLLPRRFVIGYINQEFRLTFLWLSAGGGISAVVTPSQPARRYPRLHPRLRHHLHHLPPPPSPPPPTPHATPPSWQLCLPDWPWWNCSPLEWLPVRVPSSSSSSSSSCSSSCSSCSSRSSCSRPPEWPLVRA